VHLSIFILVLNQHYAQNLFYNKFISCLYMFRAQHHVLIVRRSKLYYTASGIITPIGGRPVHMRNATPCSSAFGVNVPSINQKENSFSTFCVLHEQTKISKSFPWSWPRYMADVESQRAVFPSSVATTSQLEISRYSAGNMRIARQLTPRIPLRWV
jgi:hypothetical protein